MLSILAYMCLWVGSLAQKNVLFLVSDDMRPSISAFMGPDASGPPMVTPSLDALAERSLVLKQAHVQQALCSPSRTSLLTGRRPDTTHVYNLQDYWREVGGNFTTIPQYFKQHGYRSIGMGKILHRGSASGNDDPLSWTEPYYQPPNDAYWNNRTVSWLAVSAEERQEIPLPDDQLTERAIQTIRELAENPDEPFFLAVGFYKPHLPFTFPEEFLEFYPPESIALPEHPYAPVDMPELAWNQCQEVCGYGDLTDYNLTDGVNTTMPDFKTLELRRAYYSALSYTDSLLGQVVQELSAQGLADDTIISFWGDHGWHLGDNGEWGKNTNFELSTHAPMMISVPGLTDRGVVSDELTEFVDLFPTLVEAAGLPEIPLCPEDSSDVPVCTEGSSLLPLASQPPATWKNRIFTQTIRNSRNTAPPATMTMGYSMLTGQYRYTEWVGFTAAPSWTPDWEDLQATELYDHTIDPHETWNRAGEEEYEEIQSLLQEQLRAGWRDAMPDTRARH